MTKAITIGAVITVLMNVTAVKVIRNVTMKSSINVSHVNEPSTVRLVLLSIKLFVQVRKRIICQLVFIFSKCGDRIVESKEKSYLSRNEKCHICKEIVGPDHQCYIQKYVCKNEEESEDEEEEVENKKKLQKFIFYDFESTQESGEHQVNFCVAHRSCDKCMHLPVDAYCKTCSELPDHGREMILDGEDTLYQFCHWLFQN